MVNWKWPQTKYNDKAPWYVIIRRVVFYVPTFTAMFLFLGFVYLGWGKDMMVEIWEDLV